MDARSKRRLKTGTQPKPEDIGAIWFLELEIASLDGDLEAARAALVELERLGWDVRRRPRLLGGTEA